MNILFAVKAMNNPGGGAERVLANVASGLVQRGHRVSVLSFDPPGGTSYYALDPQIERIECAVGPADRPANPAITLKRISILRRTIASRNPDVAIGFMNSMFIPLGIALLGTGIPMIASEHIGPEYYRIMPLQRALHQLLPIVATRIVCVSDQVVQSYSPYLRRKMVAISNPVTVRPRANRAGLTKEGRRKVLLSVGRQEPQKNHFSLLEAFSRLAGAFTDWDLRLVGDGSLRDALIARAVELGLGDRVFFPGVVREIEREYGDADLFVHPSTFESFGLTTAEALAFGVPAIGFSDCTGTNQLIQDGVNGRLVDPGADRTSSLMTALKALMTDESERRRLADGAGRVAARHSLDAVVAQWEETIREVSDRPRTAIGSHHPAE